MVCRRSAGFESGVHEVVGLPGRKLGLFARQQ